MRLMDKAIWSIVGALAGSALTFVGVMQTADANDLERTKTIIEWQMKKIETCEQMVAMSEQYSKIAAIPGAYADSAKQHEIRELERQVIALLQLYQTLESSLARLQDRAVESPPELAFRQLGGPGPPGKPKNEWH